MRIKLHRDPIARAFATLTRSVDAATGRPRRFQSLDALKAACRLEEVVAHGLEQEPSNPGAVELRFHCIWHPDANPSLWVHTEKQRWGCVAGCYRSGDVIDFVVKLYDLTHKDALQWLRIWAAYPHHAEPQSMKVRLRRSRA